MIIKIIRCKINTLKFPQDQNCLILTNFPPVFFGAACLLPVDGKDVRLLEFN